jgi:hypothetical protein
MVFDHGETTTLIHKLIPLASCQASKSQINTTLIVLKVFWIIDDGSTSFSCEDWTRSVANAVITPLGYTHPTR